jgi:hypothetical protein
MAEDSSGLSARSTLVGAALAGGVSVLALTLLSSADVATPLVRVVIAIVLGVGVAQLYERRG